MEKLSNQLIEGKAKVGVWGCGYIGFTSMINFAQAGVSVKGYDTNPNVVKAIQHRECHIQNLDYWIGYSLNPLYESMESVSDWCSGMLSGSGMLADDVKVHLIAIPTEKDGEPFDKPLREVITHISDKDSDKDNPDIVIIESTLTPGMFDNIVIKILEESGKKVGEDILVGLAPRRDWFESPDKNLKNLTRVIGGTDSRTSESMKDVLGLICDKLIVVPDPHVVEMVKSVENSILHLCATYANQLAWAYPDVDIAEVLRLASTHWRIPLYYPSVGTGGYCIPLSSKYVHEGANRKEYLSLTEETMDFDAQQPYLIAKMMSRRVNKKSVGILGVSYKRDLKVHILSPALAMINCLKLANVEVKVHDPYYSHSEIKKICDVETFKYPDDISEFGGLIITPAHREFEQTPLNVLMKNLKSGQSILDNVGVWKKHSEYFKQNNINYHCVGDKGWCEVQ